MKHYLFLIFGVAAFFLGACQENEEFVYHSSDHIYFHFKDLAASKITHSFAYAPDAVEDTIFIPVRISGNRTGYSRQFKLGVVAGETTALPEKHYQPLAGFYEIAADSGTLNVPVIIYNKDPEMDDSTFTLTLTLLPTADFQVGLTYPAKACISFSNRLEQPDWWMYWMANLGMYSRVKHQLFLIASGTDELADMSKPDAYMQIPKTLFHLDQYKAFLNDPFGWVEKQEEYALTPAGDDNYHFYLKSAPEKVTLMKKDPASGIWRFIDENGQFIS